MRRFVVVGVVAVVGSALIACGGATPEAKDSEDAVSSSPAKPAAKASDDSAVAKGSDAVTKGSGATGDPLMGDSPTGSTAAQPASKSSTPSLETAGASGDDPWMASHQMTPKDVLGGTRAMRGKAQQCFHDGEKRDPSTSGEVKIKFVVANDGVVRVWRDEGSSMSDPDVIQCIGNVLKGTKFPKQKSPGEAWGVYSVNFGN
jgi:hypothetical protein